MTKTYDEKYVCRLLPESSAPWPQNQMMKTKIGLEGFFKRFWLRHTPNDVYFVSIKILFLFSFFLPQVMQFWDFSSLNGKKILSYALIIDQTNFFLKVEATAKWGDSSKCQNDVERMLKILRYLIKRRFHVVSTSSRCLEESSQQQNL